MSNKTPEYQIRAVKKYKSKFHEIKINFLPEDYSAVVTHAKKHGDSSTSSFIKRAIRETIERDNAKES